MTRSFFALAVIGFATMALTPALLQGCAQTGIGDPCTPEQEFDPTFPGFDPGEVNTEAKSFQCQTRLCLVNHFQGRVTCPYGQDSKGNPPTPASGFYQDSNKNPIVGCGIPGSVPDSSGKQSEPVVGDQTSGSKTGATVQPQCLSRTADKAVYCSCRCANLQGNTNDGANYCKCPEGYACTQLVTSIGPSDTGLTGAYCMRTGTDYQSSSCPSTLVGSPISVEHCDPSTANCGSFNGQ